MTRIPTIAESWKQVTGTFVLGLDRAGAQVISTDGAVAGLIAALPTEDGVARHLDVAGCLGVLTRAAVSFEVSNANEVLLDDCELRQPTLTAAQLLVSVLELGRPELLAEWCNLAASAGFRIADELLPRVLDLFANDPEGVFATSVSRVLDGRGRWLARRRPCWKAALDVVVEPESALESESTSDRVRAMRQLRSRNAARARELLPSRLDSETEERARLIAVLESGLSPADEPFLETVLDDKAATVRHVAAGLLARIPASAYVHRMAQRVSRLVAISYSRAKLLRKGSVVLAVCLPEPGDKALARDAIEFKAKGKLGAGAYALSQMIGAVPLDHWTKSADASPEEIVAAATKTEWSEALLLGWTMASIRQHDGKWAQAIISVYVQEPGVEPPLEVQPWLTQLLAVLGTTERMQAAEAAWAKAGAWSGLLFEKILAACDQEWSRSFCDAALFSLRKHIVETQGAFNESIRRSVSHRFALSLHPDYAESFGRGWPTDATWWPRWLDELIHNTRSILILRMNMHREFAK